MTRTLRPIAPSRGRLLRGPAGEAVCSPLEDDEFHSAENVRILEAWNVSEDPAVSIPPTEVGPGDIVLIPAGTPQRIRNPGDEDLVFYCICTPRFDESDYRRAAPGALRCDDE